MTGPIEFLNGKVTLHPGDCLDALRALPDSSIDSCVTDPPYALVSIVKRFGGKNAAPVNNAGTKAGNKGDPYARAAVGFMGKEWDTGERAFAVEFWAEVLRVLKPGGHVLAFSGTRTYHRLACAIEDAGFEIRDQIGWLYGSGFPKSHDVSKGIDKMAGAEREIIAKGRAVKRMIPGADQNKAGWEKNNGRVYEPTQTAPATDEASQWQGWGTALKPSWEPLVVARKPLEGTVAANVLAHGTGALNIDGCRVQGGGPSSPRGSSKLDTDANEGWMRPWMQDRDEVARREAAAMDRLEKLGRWPANVIHDGSEEVLAAFPDTAPSKAAAGVVRFGRSGGIMGDVGGVRDGRPEGHDDNGGSAARFFFSPEKDAHCDICRVLLTGGNAKVFSCDAITAKQNSTTRNTLPGAIVPGDAAGSRPLESGDRRQQSSAPANSAGSNSRLCLPANASSVQSDALTLETSRIAQNVRSAASLCASCETAIAQRLAATRLGLDPASLPCPAYMPARRRQILHDQLALYAAGRESTDTITTTASLKTLFGSVFHAIESTTNSERSGSAANTEAAPSRLFYSSKADADDRIGSKHPTVKPINLMRYLVRLVTPPGGVVLDPFAGTGTTGQAAFLEGFCAVLVERETEYQADIARRMELVLAGPDERARAMIKASGKMQDAGPLFAEEGA